MGSGSSGLGKGGGGAGGANATETLSAFDAVVAKESDPFDAISKIGNIMDQAMVGTQFVLNDKSMYYEFTKAVDGKWDVTIGRSREELRNNRASHDSSGMAAGEVVNCLYKLT